MTRRRECSNSPAEASRAQDPRSGGPAAHAGAAGPSPSTPTIDAKATDSAPTAKDTAPSAEGLTPEQRALRSRLGAHVRWSRCDDRVAATAPARAAFNDRWERQVDPEGLLDPHERAIRAEHAKKAHFTAMAMKSAKARARKKTRAA